MDIGVDSVEIEASGDMQQNGIQIPKIVSAEVVVPHDDVTFSGPSKAMRKAIEIMDKRMKGLRTAVQSISAPVRRLKLLSGLQTKKINKV